MCLAVLSLVLDLWRENGLCIASKVPTVEHLDRVGEEGRSERSEVTGLWGKHVVGHETGSTGLG